MRFLSPYNKPHFCFCQGAKTRKNAFSLLFPEGIFPLLLFPSSMVFRLPCFVHETVRRYDGAGYSDCAGCRIRADAYDDADGQPGAVRHKKAKSAEKDKGYSGCARPDTFQVSCASVSRALLQHRLRCPPWFGPPRISGRRRRSSCRRGSPRLPCPCRRRSMRRDGRFCLRGHCGAKPGCGAWTPA